MSLKFVVCKNGDISQQLNFFLQSRLESWINLPIKGSLILICTDCNIGGKLFNIWAFSKFQIWMLCRIYSKWFMKFLSYFLLCKIDFTNLCQKMKQSVFSSLSLCKDQIHEFSKNLEFTLNKIAIIAWNSFNKFEIFV